MLQRVSDLPVASVSPAVACGQALARRQIRADKVASVAGAAGLSNDVRIAMVTLRPRSGDIVAVKVLSENPGYDRLELPSGRLARLSVGDIFIGVIGARRALKGYVGDVPAELAVGDELHILNLGGVLGRCTGFNQAMGQPVRTEYLGAVMQDGSLLNIADYALPIITPEASSPPVIAVAGSCMHAGKTRVAVELVRRFTGAGYKVAAGKVSGIACLRDTLEMRDNGAIKTLSFLDLGFASTVGVSDLSPVAQSIIAHLGASSPDVIILELGDGLLGGYNVSSILNDQIVRDSLAALVFCAGDFVSAWGGIELLKQHGLRPDVISGAATDSRMGVDYIRQELGVPAANAIAGGAALFALVESRLLATTDEAIQ